FGYGWWRLSTLPIRTGPRTAVLQGDFQLKAEDDPKAPSDAQKQGLYLSLMREAAAQHPDLIVLPETPWSMYLNRELRRPDAHVYRNMPIRQQRIYAWLTENGQQWYNRLSNYARLYNATLVVGAMSQEKQAEGTYPAEHK